MVRLFIILAICIFPGIINAATLYMGSGETYTTLRAAAAAMSASDTLIIRDGTYSGSDNILTQTQMPPSGSAGSPTIIQAENDGAAVFPDGFVKMDNYVSGGNYVDYIGLKAQSYTSIYGCNHVRFMRCSGVYDTGSGYQEESTFGAVSGCSYILFEDCWAWGAGRYQFSCYGATLGATNHIVFRRCVARKDRSNTVNPTGAFSIYQATYVELQNCIAIDGDHDEFWVAYEEKAGAFYVHHGSQYVYLRGCIALNYASYTLGGSPGTDAFNAVDCVWWDNARGGSGNNSTNSATGAITNCTLGSMDDERDVTGGHGMYIWSGSSYIPVTNSILYDCTVGMQGYETSDYNCFYSNGTNLSGIAVGDHDIIGTNPISASLLYLPRIESGSALDNAGNGGDMGANVLYKYGTDHTFYGDSGYATITGNDLWPWPNEDRIKTDMAAYSYTGAIYPSGSDTLSGARGFCASGKQLNGTDDITLTSYIWEYLGNQMPSDIYGETQTTHLNRVNLNRVIMH